ncbi:alpha-ketoglutarate-dependent -dichlorophenoxyacetate [Colletotrichum plurivorum]|uniref:Alpha-ketoglutarate-dependent -dichlorophenoxyacetate n=1 Tax=Colletotrichum plurivorum TaxID=2175906 RepID=A0A8H6KKF6_9PEZI|nr:alpha-ketoglutarate-dependent -dichlorophenoxyacetate [Colletotrichum plurivorum]
MSAIPQLNVKELHPYFGAEISGINFSESIRDDVFDNILALSAKYGVLVFRSTGLDDPGHIDFARRFGTLYSMKHVLGDTKGRLGTDELADLSNVDSETGEPIPGEGPKAHIAKLSSFFHADLAYTQPRASWSLLKSHEIPPPGYGGDTVFADTRTAFQDLDEIELGLKDRLMSNDYVGVHSWQHALKISNPDMFKDLDPSAYPMAKHRLVELHRPSGRLNLYIGLYLHHIECAPEEEDEMASLQHKLLQHATKTKYQLSIDWHDPGDMIIWDNRTVMHKAGPGTYAGKFRRDLRRATVLDT